MLVNAESGIKFRLEEAQKKIAKAAEKSGRHSEDVTLVVVTKAQPVEVLEAVIEAGAMDLGENYPEEAAGKIDLLRGRYPHVRWHMIGHLQSRKSRLVVDHFDWIQSIDSLHLAEKVNRILAEQGKSLRVLLEVNVSEEQSKFGWNAQDEKLWPGLIAQVEPVFGFEHLQVCGLMSMPPLFEDPEKTRPYFTKLRKLSDYFRKLMPGSLWQELSIGTSADYEVAIQEGATIVRIGQAITGPRPKKIPEPGL